MKTYLINDLYNEDKFAEFKNELMTTQQRRVFRDMYDVNDFLKQFDDANESRDVVFSDYDDEEEIYNEFKKDAEVEAYAEVEIGNASYVRLYGYYTCEDWSEEDNVYQMCSFGGYFKVEIC